LGKQNKGVRAQWMRKMPFKNIKYFLLVIPLDAAEYRNKKGNKAIAVEPDWTSCSNAQAMASL